MTERYTPEALARLLEPDPAKVIVPTEAQQRVICAPVDAPALVVAGAGSGKTETMAARVVWLVANGLAEPGQILGLTFTRNDIQTGIFHSAAGSDGGHLLSGVADHLTLSVGGSGITGLVSSLVNGTVMPILRPLLVSILSSLDPTVDALLQTLGVKLGTLDVTVHGVACGRATIVG